ncbi:tyrosine-type recombinase/integrase [Brevundimonas nasdae]|uniref:tyrosine-type recombinase/integrase n=1 Tax=Brevundimonas nasdae TaxID=172043 RepID=UPI003F694CDE
MAMLPIKGVHIVRSKGRDYVYAWRGGPRLKSEPGTDAFVQELAELRKGHVDGDRSKFRFLISSYKASDDWKGLAPKSRANWTPFLDKLDKRFGDTSILAFDRPLIRVPIRQWRDQMKHTPRQADMALQVLSRILSFGVAEGRLQNNACSGIPRIYKSNRADIIWTPADIAAIDTHSSREVMFAIRLAALTGLRKGDLLKLNWSHVKEHSIEISTGKSSNRKTTLIPIYRELRELLSEIPVRSTRILTNQKGHPWQTGFNASYRPYKLKAGLDHLHFHDLRGTAATRMYLAGLTIREIAHMFTWSEDQVEKLINVYVRKDELILDRIRRIDELEARTPTVKPAVKPSA